MNTRIYWKFCKMHTWVDLNVLTTNRDEKYLDNQHIMKFFMKTKIKIQYIYRDKKLFKCLANKCSPMTLSILKNIYSNSQIFQFAKCWLLIFP
jgi:hypothetical protein